MERCSSSTISETYSGSRVRAMISMYAQQIYNIYYIQIKTRFLGLRLIRGISSSSTTGVPSNPLLLLLDGALSASSRILFLIGVSIFASLSSSNSNGPWASVRATSSISICSSDMIPPCSGSLSLFFFLFLVLSFLGFLGEGTNSVPFFTEYSRSMILGRSRSIVAIRERYTPLLQLDIVRHIDFGFAIELERATQLSPTTSRLVTKRKKWNRTLLCGIRPRQCNIRSSSLLSRHRRQVVGSINIFLLFQAAALVNTNPQEKHGAYYLSSSSFNLPLSSSSRSW